MTTSNNQHGESKIHEICKECDFDELKKHNTTGYMNMSNHRGTTPIIYAAMNKGCTLQFMTYLLEHGADPRERSSFSNKTPAQTAGVYEIDKKVFDLLNLTWGKYETAINKSPYIENKYRNAKWSRQTEYYLSLPSELQTMQFSSQYLCEPNVAALYKSRGLNEAWKYCAQQDQEVYQLVMKFDQNKEDVRCLGCGKEILIKNWNCEYCKAYTCSKNCTEKTSDIHTQRCKAKNKSNTCNQS